MKIVVKNFNELSRSELYEILQLRSEIFVLEQNCVYQDIDGIDKKALHVLGVKNNQLVGYSRCYCSENKTVHIGRVLVKKSERKQGFSHELLKTSIKSAGKNYGSKTIRVSAQQYLIGFYEKHGFKTIGDGYLEDGIPHIAMVRDLKDLTGFKNL